MSGKTMFDEIPFQNVTANSTSQPKQKTDILAPNPSPTLADGAYELIFSSGKVAAEAASASLRSIWSVLMGPASAAFAKVGNNHMDPLAKPAGVSDMLRAGAGGGSVIDAWAGIIADDVAAAGPKIKSAISMTGVEIKKGATSTVEVAAGGVKKTLNWAGSVVGSTIGGVFSGLGFAGNTVIILIVAGVAIFFLAPYVGPLLASRASRS